MPPVTMNTWPNGDAASMALLREVADLSAKQSETSWDCAIQMRVPVERCSCWASLLLHKKRLYLNDISKNRCSLRAIFRVCLHIGPSFLESWLQSSIGRFKMKWLVMLLSLIPAVNIAIAILRLVKCHSWAAPLGVNFWWTFSQLCWTWNWSFTIVGYARDAHTNQFSLHRAVCIN